MLVPLPHGKLGYIVQKTRASIVLVSLPHGKLG